MNTAGLSLSDAPPFEKIYPFFIAASVYGFLSFAALSFANEPNRFDPYIIGGIHLFTIGFLLNAIFGSLVQMLPVVGGIKIDSPKIIKLTFISINLGALMFFAGLAGFKAAMFPALLALSVGVISFFSMLLLSLFTQKQIASETVKGMRLSLIIGFAALLLGIHLLSSHAIGRIGESHLKFVNLHIIFAVFGFIGILIVSVSKQVLPMFYVAPEFPKFCNFWPLVIFGAVLCAAIPLNEAAIASKIAIWIALSAFATVALKKLKERRRLLSDASLKMWQTGLVSLIVAISIWGYSAVWEVQNLEYLLAVLFGYGFIASIVKAMINKIVPFLAWFHLTSRGKWDAPSVREMITDKSANIELYLHWVAIFLFLSGYLSAIFMQLGSAFAALSFAVLAKNVYTATTIYKKNLPAS